MKRRSFYNGALNHCYQRTSGHEVLFYSVTDYLVFFTIFCTMALRHKVRVLKLVQMPDHTHHSTVTCKRGQLSAFSRDYTSIFAKEYNQAFGLRGSVFETPFSSALKRSDKDIRTNLIYLDNNPVERKLTTRAEDYRWNYLAYAQSDHPFSEKIVLRKASMPLRRALDSVKRMHSKGRFLGYCFLKNLFSSISTKREREQLIDFIISTYSIIEHQEAISYFGDYQKELLAAHATKGSEYEISETFIGKDDKWYSCFTNILLEKGMCKDVHEVLTMPIPEKQRLFDLLRRETMAPWRQIAAYLHLPVERMC